MAVRSVSAARAPLRVQPQTPLPRDEVMAWLKRRKITQYRLANAIGREPSLVSKVIRGVVKSGPVWSEIRGFMKDPAGYRPVEIRSQLQRYRLERARAVLRDAGYLR